MRKSLIFVATAGVLSFHQSAAAEGVALGAKASTLGLGAELVASLTPRLNGRVGYNNYDYEYSGTESDIDYDFTFKLESIPLYLDIYPFKGRFHLTGGLLLNQNLIDADAEPTGGFYEINGVQYPAFGTSLAGEITFDDTAAYLGVGWGNPVKGKGLGVNFEIGVVLQGAPDVEFTASGPATALPGFQQNLNAEAQALEDDLEKFKYYPVIALGLTYKF